MPSVTFNDWTGDRPIGSLGTNAGARTLPFQSWRHFKEAFAPELVSQAVVDSPTAISSCLDPFGGSGTAALACQFLGIHPITFEVNPFLADLIEAKLYPYDADKLASDLGTVIRNARAKRVQLESQFGYLPATFIEPGVSGRWLFDTDVATRIAGLLTAIDELDNIGHRRLFRVLLGGILVPVSNVVVNGKGRRYRQGVGRSGQNTRQVLDLFVQSAQRALGEIHRYSGRACVTYTAKCGDSKELLPHQPRADVAVFSPPYPNSFDYTDVYNVELWMLGYICDAGSNRALRQSTLCSHVQVSRAFPSAPSASELLQATLQQLESKSSLLWDPRIPAMIGGYFTDLMTVLVRLRDSIRPGGTAWTVLGDSQYAGVHVRVADILAELAPTVGWRLDRSEQCRSMRASAQQGGQHALPETLMVLAAV